MDVFSRLYQIVRARNAFDGDPLAEASPADAESESEFEGAKYEYAKQDPAPTEDQDPVLAGYYANLEIPYGSDIGVAKRAWKDMMKQYHPDMHSSDPQKRKIANELCAELTRAYQELEKLLV